MYQRCLILVNCDESQADADSIDRYRAKKRKNKPVTAIFITNARPDQIGGDLESFEEEHRPPRVHLCPAFGLEGERERGSVCVRERERKSVYVCVSERERESARVQERG